MTMTSERPNQDFAELFGPPPGDEELASLLRAAGRQGRG